MRRDSMSKANSVSVLKGIVKVGNRSVSIEEMNEAIAAGGAGQVVELDHYKGYVATIEYSDKDACFVGHLVGTDNDIVGFHGDTEAELQQAFEEAVDDYIRTKRKVGR